MPVICANLTKDAHGLWTCGRPGRTCNQTHNWEVFCDVKPERKGGKA